MARSTAAMCWAASFTTIVGRLPSAVQLAVDGISTYYGDIRRQTRRKYNAEEKIRIVLEGLRGEDSIAGLCRREGINPNMYYKWSKAFLEAGKARLSGDSKRAALAKDTS